MVSGKEPGAAQRPPVLTRWSSLFLLRAVDTGPDGPESDFWMQRTDQGQGHSFLIHKEHVRGPERNRLRINMVDDCNLNVWFLDGKESLHVYLHLILCIYHRPPFILDKDE